MDALTGRRRRHEHETETTSTSFTIGTNNTDRIAEAHSSSSKKYSPGLPKGKEYVPELYKSIGIKKLRLEQPETEEDKAMMKSLPCDTEAALLHIKSTFPVDIFQNRLPPIALYSQLSSIISNQYLIDTQLTKLAKENKIITFSTFTSSNYLIVFQDDFARIKRKGVFHRFVVEALMSKDDVLSSSESNEVRIVKRSVENSRYFTKESLMKRWKFEEDEIRQLVNGGYLGIQEGGIYCLSLPGAGEFTKCYEKGKKSVMSAIKRAKFSEILQRELEQRQMKKTTPLGILYHIHDLKGSGEIDKIDTTSGPLLRIKRKR